jgi:hypothetical protein
VTACRLKPPVAIKRLIRIFFTYEPPRCQNFAAALGKDVRRSMANAKIVVYMCSPN